MPFVRELALPGDAGAPTDRQLLERFLILRQEAACRALVERHGPMVLDQPPAPPPSATAIRNVWQPCRPVQSPTVTVT